MVDALPNVYWEVLLVTPSNTSISVEPPVNEAILPLKSAANVWDSLVKNAVTASEPAEPSEPVSPPTILNILDESLKESLDTAILSGKSDLLNDENGNANVLVPVPLLTEPPNDGVVNVAPPAFVIVISDVAIVPLKFCWLTTKFTDEGVAVVSTELSNANVWESATIETDFASAPAKPAVPCLDLTKLIVLVKLTLAEVAVILTEPESCDNAVIVTVFPLSFATTPGPLDEDIV